MNVCVIMLYYASITNKYYVICLPLYSGVCLFTIKEIQAKDFNHCLWFLLSIFSASLTHFIRYLYVHIAYAQWLIDTHAHFLLCLLTLVWFDLICMFLISSWKYDATPTESEMGGGVAEKTNTFCLHMIK